MSEDTPNPHRFGERARAELFHQRILVLDGPLDDDNGMLLLSQLISLASEDPRTDISLWIHSPGGSVPSMLAIRDVIRTIGPDVATLALGTAYSAGQFLLSAGTRGKRRALPHASILMHQGSAGFSGTAVDVETQADELRHVRDTVLALIAEDTGQDPAQVFTDSLHDRWFTAKEALAYGFIDEILDSFETLALTQRKPVGIGPQSGINQQNQTLGGPR